MLPFALESAGWGSERCGIKLPLGDRETMLEGDPPTSPRFERVLRGLRRQGRKERRRRRSRRAGGGRTEKISAHIFTFLILVERTNVYQFGEDRLKVFQLSIEERIYSYGALESVTQTHPLIIRPPARLDSVRVSSISSPTMP